MRQKMPPFRRKKSGKSFPVKVCTLDAELEFNLEVSPFYAIHWICATFLRVLVASNRQRFIWTRVSYNRIKRNVVLWTAIRRFQGIYFLAQTGQKRYTKQDCDTEIINVNFMIWGYLRLRCVIIIFFYFEVSLNVVFQFKISMFWKTTRVRHLLCFWESFIPKKWQKSWCKKWRSICFSCKSSKPFFPWIFTANPKLLFC